MVAPSPLLGDASEPPPRPPHPSPRGPAWPGATTARAPATCPAATASAAALTPRRAAPAPTAPAPAKLCAPAACAPARRWPRSMTRGLTPSLGDGRRGQPRRRPHAPMHSKRAPLPSHARVRACPCSARWRQLQGKRAGGGRAAGSASITTHSGQFSCRRQACYATCGGSDGGGSSNVHRPCRLPHATRAKQAHRQQRAVVCAASRRQPPVSARKFCPTHQEAGAVQPLPPLSPSASVLCVSVPGALGVPSLTFPRN
jgi:hypothetical protein